MALDIAAFGVAFALSIVFLCSVIKDNLLRSTLNQRCIVAISTLGVVVFLAVMLLSFNFTSFTHLRAELKYDHAIAVTYETNAAPPITVDKAKVIYCDASPNRRTTTVLMAWNDNETYADLTQSEK